MDRSGDILTFSQAEQAEFNVAQILSPRSAVNVLMVILKLAYKYYLGGLITQSISKLSAVKRPQMTEIISRHVRLPYLGSLMEFLTSALI